MNSYKLNDLGLYISGFFIKNALLLGYAFGYLEFYIQIDYIDNKSKCYDSIAILLIFRLKKKLNTTNCQNKISN